MKSVVIALGGNALLDPSGRQSFAKENKNINIVMKSIALLCKNKAINLAITHGNGSQVGDELMRNEHAKKYVPRLPLYVLNAETQASIGTLLENSLRNNLSKTGVKKDVCVILAHALVDDKDHAFRNPSKPIGPLYTAEELDSELKLERFNYINVGSNYRRVVASPKPKSILEIEPIRSELKDNIVITCGGGGIPSIRRGSSFAGVNAVIDKDSTSQLLANLIGADTLIILTNADYVYKDYKNREGRLEDIPASKLRKYLYLFEEGTIRPKIEACINFVDNGGKEAYIGNVFSIVSILKRTSGTRIY